MTTANPLFPRSTRVEEKHTKTYATEEGLYKALTKLGVKDERFMVVRTETGRWTALFLGYYMVGTPEDCAFATYAFEVLCKTFLRLVNQYLKEHGLPRTPRYFNGYWDGLRIGFCDAWQKAQRAEIKQAGAESYALVLVDKDKALTAFIAQDKGIKMKSTNRNTDYASTAAGIRDGAKISIHRALGGASDNKVQLV